MTWQLDKSFCLRKLEQLNGVLEDNLLLLLLFTPPRGAWLNVHVPPSICPSRLLLLSGEVSFERRTRTFPEDDTSVTRQEIPSLLSELPTEVHFKTNEIRTRRTHFWASKHMRRTIATFTDGSESLSSLHLSLLEAAINYSLQYQPHHVNALLVSGLHDRAAINNEKPGITTRRSPSNDCLRGHGEKKERKKRNEDGGWWR